MRKVPPSRLRYEASHPTISIRVDRGLYDELQSIKQKGDKSFADILREGLGIQQATVGESYERGFADAKERYVVRYTCSTCGELIELTSMKAKEFAAAAMTEGGWGHADCHQS